MLLTNKTIYFPPHQPTNQLQLHKNLRGNRAWSPLPAWTDPQKKTKEERYIGRILRIYKNVVQSEKFLIRFTLDFSNMPDSRSTNVPENQSVEVLGLTYVHQLYDEIDTY